MHGCYTQNIEVWFSLFLVVRTSIGIGRVVGTIIPQYENEELITEGLSILTQWNPDWKPRFFMMDKSSVELGPVAAIHPQCFRLLCDFHRAQAVEMWVNKGTNGVHPTDKALVTEAFRRLAYATTGKLWNTIDNKTMSDAYKFCN